VVPIDQDVGHVRRDNIFLWSEAHHIVRHAGGLAAGRRNVTEPAVGLIGKVGVKDRLIFGSERRLLSVTGRLRLIVALLAANPGLAPPPPLALQVWVFPNVDDLRAGRKDAASNDESKCERGPSQVHSCISTICSRTEKTGRTVERGPGL